MPSIVPNYPYLGLGFFLLVNGHDVVTGAARDFQESLVRRGPHTALCSVIS